MAKVDCSNIFNFMSEWERRSILESKHPDFDIHQDNPKFSLDDDYESLVTALQKWSEEHPR